ncbi:MAG TPA: fumarylacetoacetate hydrolase family protein [Gemmatimonadales bacterium]|nr:fumarylacetoacetate hydrolase family protein [Gemmatimonadales bacterium]
MTKPGKIIAVGRNYRAHAEELGNAMPAEPMTFLKPPSAVIAHGETIILPPVSQKVEQEAEIGVVILERMRHLTREQAERARFGITCVNDVTARDLQKTDGQWGRAKGFDTFCPMGPRVVEGLDWRGLEIIGRVNGQEVQRGKASDMAFDIPTLLVFISGVMTLEPGDLIATGTPAGTTALKSGDVVEVEIPGVGVLRNPVSA